MAGNLSMVVALNNSATIYHTVSFDHVNDRARIEIIMSLNDYKKACSMADKSSAQDAEIDRLREEISTLRNLARVRVADGFRGGE